ncbi:MAG: undecaprenyl/decaprenyl-phosphate alpha-N-acetylglucosaminyl 1-phosphate transferase [Phycisphaeraceae bacterium]|nr:undecaprenyl/decaprenyl-phosphate alpha-N-acetylglucosaminyl 1-phosphate transferase [Phycisphaeraceae bacterium]
MTEALHPHLPQLFLGLIATLIATPVFRALAIRNRIVDRPDDKRKWQKTPIAYLGGMAVFVGWLVAMLAFLIRSQDPASPTAGAELPIYIILGAFVIVLVGLLDDVVDLSPSLKVAGQFVAAACLANQTFVLPYSEPMILGQALVIGLFNLVGVTLPPMISYTAGTLLLGLFVLGGCNAVNLIDGLDGLCTGITAITASAFLFFALTVMQLANFWAELPTGPQLLMQADFQIAMCIAIIAAMLGFLPYNFNPAVIFLGDAGSMLIGYLCVALILMFATTGGIGPLLVVAAMIAFAIPVLDTGLTIARRYFQGQPLFKPGPQHTYVQLVRWLESRGHSFESRVRTGVLLLYAIAIALAVVSCLVVVNRWFLALAALLILALILVTCLHRSAKTARA